MMRADFKHPSHSYASRLRSNLRALEQQEHSAELVGGVSVTESDGTKSEAKEQRPVANVSGWFRTSKTDKGWTTSFMVESVN